MFEAEANGLLRRRSAHSATARASSRRRFVEAALAVPK